MAFTPLKFQDNLSCIFLDFSTKGAKSKVSNYLLVDSVYITLVKAEQMHSNENGG